MAYYQTPFNYPYGFYPAVQPYPQNMVIPQQQMIEQQQMSPTQTSGTSQSQSVQTASAPMDSSMVWVQGKAGAQSYPVARGTTLPLFDSEGDFIYIKSVDNNGIPLPLVTKVLSDPPIEVKSEEVEVIQVDTSEFVTKKVYDDLLKKYEDLELRIMDLETRPTPTITSTFTGNTFNNSKERNKNESKFTI